MATSPRIRKLARVVARIRERGSSRELADPLTTEDLDALQAELGVPLPAEVRAFFGGVTGGETGYAGVPPLLDPRAGRALLGRPDAPFPVSPTEVGALLPRPEDGPVPASDAEPDGLLAISDHGCATYDAVVLAGPLAGQVWQSWDGGLTPHLRADGQPLRFLDWAEARLTEILAAAPPKVRPSTTELDYLWSDAKLTAFPQTIRQAKGLRRLVLASQLVRRLPPWIGELTELRDLMCGGCELEELPDGLGELSALERLSLSKNHLRSLPQGLARLPRLRSFDVWGNELRALPPLGELPALEQLDVSQNHLTELDRALPPTLRELKLTRNPLRRLPEALTNTSVGELRLEELPELDLAASLDVLARTGALRTLALYGLRPPPEALGALTGLTTLRVMAAGWDEVPRSLAALTSLETLSLDQNQLTDLPEWLFELPALRQVVLFSNPFPAERAAALAAAHPGVKLHGAR